MSLFSKAFSDCFVPLLMHWHGDPAVYVDPVDGTRYEIAKAVISDERRQRRRINEYEVDVVVVRSAQIVTDQLHADYSGVMNPEENATFEIIEGSTLLKYVVETVSDGDHGMAKLNLRRTERTLLASRESITK